MFSVRQDTLIVSILSPSVTKFYASISFMFSSASTLFGCKVDGIFSARTPLKPLAPQGEEEEPVLCFWMSGYFLVKNFKVFLKSHHNSSGKKKIRKKHHQPWRISKNHEELKEKLNTVMTNHLYLHNIFHQCSSLPYTSKEIGCIS